MSEILLKLADLIESQRVIALNEFHVKKMVFGILRTGIEMLDIS